MYNNFFSQIYNMFIQFVQQGETIFNNLFNTLRTSVSDVLQGIPLWDNLPEWLRNWVLSSSFFDNSLAFVAIGGFSILIVVVRIAKSFLP